VHTHQKNSLEGREVQLGPKFSIIFALVFFIHVGPECLLKRRKAFWINFDMFL